MDWKLANISTPLWLRLEGLPVTVTSRNDNATDEKVPGTQHWMPKGTLDRLQRGLETDTPTSELVSDELSRDKTKSLVQGSTMGGIGGLVAGRLLSGEEGMAPIRDIASKGLNKSTFQALRNLPNAMKMLPAAGLGGGALLGYMKWRNSKDNQREDLVNTLGNLRGERLIRDKQLNEALQAQPNSSVLRKLPTENAHHSAPYVATTNVMGV